MQRRSSQNLLALLWRLARLVFSKPTRWLVLFLVALACMLFIALGRQAPVHVATFNIQDYPKSAGQAAGALELLGSLDADVLAVQEITRPAHFEAFVEDYLGPRWRFVVADQPRVRHKVGLVYDTEDFELLAARTHRETAISRGARATLEVELRTDGLLAQRTVRVFVVHLKAGGDNAEIRREQLRRLRPVVEAAVASGDEVILLGDFNTTGQADRDTLDALADATQLHWSTEELRCTSYWKRPTDCPGTPLDHILSTDRADAVELAGACKTVGCETRRACPTYVELVSDHCPVRAIY